MTAAIHSLRVETEAARSLLANMRDILGDDADLTATAVEGETQLREALAAGLKRYRELDAMKSGIADMQTSLSERLERFDRQVETLRTALMVAMDAGQIKRFEHALGTISTKAVPPKPIYTDETSIPSRFWKPSDPKLDKKAVHDALKAGEDVPGATMSNGGTTIQIKLG